MAQGGRSKTWRTGLTVAVVIGSMVAVVAAVGFAVGGLSPLLAGARDLFRTVDDPGPRPAFQLPLSCGQTWRLSTYAGHNPDDKKIDMFAVDGPTEGEPVLASAPGRVVRLVRPGGVKIDHGGRWYTLSLHMEDIAVSAGQEVAAGDRIGRVGAVGTAAAHLHYEQLFDADGSGDAPPSEIVTPVIQGTEYTLQPGTTDWPVVTSRNACASTASD